MSGNQGRVIGVGGPRLKVQVTQHDIEWGARDDSSRCMVSRAVAREVDDATRIEVDTQTIRFSTAAGRFAYLTPLTVQRYVAAFDAGDKVEPFSFTLQNPLRIKQRVLTPEERADNRLRQLTERRTKGGIGPRGPRPRGPGDIASPPRVFKTKKRTYGARLLRINQPRQSTTLDESQEQL
jgi:hypothetical protein